MPKTKGRPRQGKEVQQTYSMRLEPKDAEFLRGLGNKNLSEGVRFAIRVCKSMGHEDLHD